MKNPAWTVQECSILRPSAAVSHAQDKRRGASLLGLAAGAALFITSCATLNHSISASGHLEQNPGGTTTLGYSFTGRVDVGDLLTRLGVPDEQLANFGISTPNTRNGVMDSKRFR